MPREGVQILRRRPPGDRGLVYLDQSTLSDLVRDEGHAQVRSLLEKRCHEGTIVCPKSFGHGEETVRAADELWEEIGKLANTLSYGINFRPRPEIEWRELQEAAAVVATGASLGDLWEEAFDTDPHIARDELFMDFFGGKIRVQARIAPDELQREEVDRMRQLEEIAQDDYQRLRDRGITEFADLAETLFEAALDVVLGPIFAPEDFHEELAAREQALADALATGEQIDTLARGPLSRAMTYRDVAARTENLLSRYPKLADQKDEFRSGLEGMPAIRYPALLRAALAADPRRTAKPGDGYDIDHLTLGLSRCDVATADRAMCHYVLQHDLVPDGCELVRAGDADHLADAVERAAAQSPAEPSAGQPE